MKITDRHAQIIASLAQFGSYYPTSSDTARAALELCRAGLCELDDAFTQRTRYLPTSDGEVIAEELKTMPKSARVFVFNRAA